MNNDEIHIIKILGEALSFFDLKTIKVPTIIVVNLKLSEISMKLEGIT
jgi:hypothetical protein